MRLKALILAMSLSNQIRLLSGVPVFFNPVHWDSVYNASRMEANAAILMIFLIRQPWAVLYGAIVLFEKSERVWTVLPFLRKARNM